MKTSLLQLAFGFLVLVLSAGAEEFLPKPFGVGFPFLLSAVQVLALGTGTWPFAVVIAVCAGALEDGLSALPPMTSVSYFLMCAVLVRRLGFPQAMMVLTYPCYQLWLMVWTSGLGGSVFLRFLLAFPLGFATALVVGVAVGWGRKEAAIDEQG